MSSASDCEHFTSNRMGAPGTRVSTSRANSASNWSPHTMRPLPVTAPMRSASPSKPMPSSAPVSFTLRCRSTSSSGTVGSGRWFGNRPSSSANSGVTVWPILSNTWGTTVPAQPLPQSITTRSPLGLRHLSTSIAR